METGYVSLVTCTIVRRGVRFPYSISRGAEWSYLPLNATNNSHFLRSYVGCLGETYKYYLISYKNFIEWVHLFFPFYVWTNWSLEKASKLPMRVQLLSDESLAALTQRYNDSFPRTPATVWRQLSLDDLGHRSTPEPISESEGIE